MKTAKLCLPLVLLLSPFSVLVPSAGAGEIWLYHRSGGEKVLYTVVNGRIYDAATMNQMGNHPAQRTKYWWERD